MSRKQKPRPTAIFVQDERNRFTATADGSMNARQAGKLARGLRALNRAFPTSGVRG